MKEQDFIKIINEQTKSPYLGDDCAYIKELGIVVTQDNFVENVHFKTEWSTPYQIGYKAAAVNISDILASGAKPSFITVGLSLPANINNSFIKELYKGIQDGAYGAEIIGGDITGGEKIFISITAIGKTEGRRISSRKNAKKDYIVITNGDYGISSKGLKELQMGYKNTPSIRAHLEPILDVKFSECISTQIQTDYAMMDTSDGLADALFKIAEASNVKIITGELDSVFASEDYNLVAVVPEYFLNNIENYKIIGKVVDFDGCYLQIGNKKYSDYNDLELFDHFNS